MIEPLHIGDGVYAICEAHDDGTLLLRTGSHESDNCNDSIILEPPVIDALIKYIERMRGKWRAPNCDTPSLATSEALDMLHAKAPTFTFSAQKTAWLHVYESGPVGRQCEYTVSAHSKMGAGGTCQNFYGETLQSAVDQCIAKLFPEPENNLE